MSWFDISPAAVHDSLGDRIIVCNGWEVWARPAAASGDWTQLGPQKPDPYEDMSLGWGAGIALDTRRNRLILTGGIVTAGKSQWRTTNGVWSFSLGASPEWTRIGAMPEPCGSTGHDSYYDPIHDRLVLVGGKWICGRFRASGLYGPTVWSTPLDTAINWTKRESFVEPLPPAPPLARSAWDPGRGRVYVFSDTRAWSVGIDEPAPWAPFEFSTPSPTVSSPVVYDRGRDQVLALFATAAGTDSIQAWALAMGPLSVSLLGHDRSSGAIDLRWQSNTAIGRAATIERREAPADWVTLGPLAFDARGFATFFDPGAIEGHDYVYRVSIAGGSSTWHSQEFLAAEPSSLRLALHGARPNPAVGNIQLAFSLPGIGPARLEIFDLRGRRCASREVGALGGGRHWLTIEASALPPGVYYARLHRGRESRASRLVLLR